MVLLCLTLKTNLDSWAALLEEECILREAICKTEEAETTEEEVVEDREEWAEAVICLKIWANLINSSHSSNRCPCPIPNRCPPACLVHPSHNSSLP